MAIEIDCEFCSLKFANILVLKLHIRLVHKSEVEGINRLFSDVKLRHCEVILEKLSEKEIVQKLASKSELNFINILFSDVKLQHCEVILQKLSENDIIQCKATNRSRSKAKFQCDFRVKSFECEHCDRTYSSKKALTLHSKTKHLAIKYDCDLCDMKFATPATKLNHIYTTHKRRFHCNACDKTFAFGSRLARHNLIKHGIKSLEKKSVKNVKIVMYKCEKIKIRTRICKQEEAKGQ